MGIPHWPILEKNSGCQTHFLSDSVLSNESGSQMAERLGSWAINQKVASSIPGCAILCCVLGQGTSPYWPRGKYPCTYCKSLWIRASTKCKCKFED